MVLAAQVSICSKGRGCRPELQVGELDWIHRRMNHGSELIQEESLNGLHDV